VRRAHVAAGGIAYPAAPDGLEYIGSHDFVRMVASGYPNKAIASVLEISSWTVASHLRRISIKLQVSSRAAVVTRLSSPALNELSASRADLDNQVLPLDLPGR
jgi:hypothetical protein